MMRKIIFLIVLLLLAISSHAQEEDIEIFSSSDMLIKLDMDSTLNLVEHSADARTVSLNAELALFPKDNWRQEVLDFSTTPDTGRDNGNLIYTWTNPTKEIKYSFDSKVKTKYSFMEINKKIPFPYPQIDNYKEYFEFTDNIDTNDQIVQIATELAEGEDDLYVLVHKIAEWIKQNVEYDFKFADTLEKPSTTIVTRQGVCDEITALFISMLRSLGIPTRYVSGYAYTNLIVPKDFGPHAWAEVYFPDIGWVPFDITYNQFGFIDATHIVLKESADSGTYSSKFRWVGKSTELISGELDFKAKILDKGDMVKPKVKLEPIFIKPNVGFSSYNIFEVTVTNPNDYYLGVTVYVTKSNELEMFDENRKDILLRPKEEKRLYWKVKIVDDLNTEFRYTIPMGAYLLDQEIVASELDVSKEHEVFSEANIDALYGRVSSDGEEKQYSKELDLSCLTDNREVIIGETTKIRCVLQNKGNKNIVDMQLCHLNDCQECNLGIMQEKDFEFETQFDTPGKKQVSVLAISDLVLKIANIDVNVADQPNIDINLMECKDKVGFDEEFTIEFMLNKTSFAVPKDIDITFELGNIDETWNLEDLEHNQKITLNLFGKNLLKKKTMATITADYKDEAGNLYKEQQVIPLELTDLSAYQTITLFALRVGTWMDNGVQAIKGVFGAKKRETLKKV